MMKTLFSFNFGNRSCSIQPSNTSVVIEQLNKLTVSNLFLIKAPMALQLFLICQLNVPSARVPL